MKRKAFGLGIFLVFGLILITYGAQERAEMALINGRIYTVAEQNPWAEALAVREGRIVALGTTAEIQRLIGPQTRVIDAEVTLSFPGSSILTATSPREDDPLPNST